MYLEWTDDIRDFEFSKQLQSLCKDHNFVAVGSHYKVIWGVEFDIA